MSATDRNGFTIIEFGIILVILAILAAMLLPVTRGARDVARRMQCSNNLKQLALSCHNYEASFKCFPNVSGGTGSELGPHGGNCDRRSGFVALLPFLEVGSFAQEIAEEQTIGDITFPPGGPAPWVTAYPPWVTPPALFTCTSGEPPRAAPNSIARVSYAFSIGDVAEDIRSPTVLRGAFAVGMYPKIEQYHDGMSNTVAILEVGNRYSQRASDTFAIDQSLSIIRNPTVCRTLVVKGEYRSDIGTSTLGRGGRWNDGAPGLTLTNTILPPNAPSCSTGDETSDGIFSAGSYHTAGINVAIADGSVMFISDSIDCGDLTATPPSFRQPRSSSKRTESPFGVWGALGTRAGQETRSLE